MIEQSTRISHSRLPSFDAALAWVIETVAAIEQLRDPRVEIQPLWVQDFLDPKGEQRFYQASVSGTLKGFAGDA